MTESIYEDRALGAPDVCSNCFRQVRVERLEPSRSGLRANLESILARNPRTTEIGYGPSDAASESKGTFCECGSESARHRIWSGDDIDDERFKDLVANLVVTLEDKGVSLKRKETIGYALQKFNDGAGPDEALAVGVDAGVVAEAVG